MAEEMIIPLPREPEPEPEPEPPLDAAIDSNDGSTTRAGAERRNSAGSLLTGLALATGGALPPLAVKGGQLAPIGGGHVGASGAGTAEEAKVGLDSGWGEARLKGGSGAGLPASMRQHPSIPPRGAPAAAARTPEAGMNCAISSFLAMFSFFTVFMLYLYMLKLDQDELVGFWATCACLSLAFDCLLVQPVKIFLNSRKAIKFSRQQTNARITARTAAGGNRCCVVVQQKHFWLLSCFIEPPNNPYTIGRRLVTQLFVLLVFIAGSAMVLRLFSSGEPAAKLQQQTDSNRRASDSDAPPLRSIDESEIVWLTAVLTSLLMFPLSKLVVDLSNGAKGDTQDVFDFAQGQVVRRSKSARCVLPSMVVAITFAAGKTAHECWGDSGLVAEGRADSWVAAFGIALAIDVLVLQTLRAAASMMKKSGGAERSAVAIEFDWI
jgi:hypothetical protein